MENIMKLLIVIDGYFILELYRKAIGLGKKVNFTGLITYITQLLQQKYGNNIIVSMECYIGLNPHPSPIETQFLTELRNAGFAIHGRQIRPNGKEKGLDGEIVWHIAEKAILGIIDALILLAGDFDHITPIQNLKLRNIPTFLVSGISKASDSYYSEDLKDACEEFYDFFELLENPKTYSSIPAYSNHSPRAVVGKKPVHIAKSASVPGIHKKPVSAVQTPIVKRNPRNSSLTPAQILQNKVKGTIADVIQAQSQKQGRHLVFCLQAEVGKELKRRGITLPESLGSYLAARPSVFRVGTHPYTKARTVSV